MSLLLIPAFLRIQLVKKTGYNDNTAQRLGMRTTLPSLFLKASRSLRVHQRSRHVLGPSPRYAPLAPPHRRQLCPATSSGALCAVCCVDRVWYDAGLVSEPEWKHPEYSGGRTLGRLPHVGAIGYTRVGSPRNVRFTRRPHAGKPGEAFPRTYLGIAFSAALSPSST